MKKKKVIIVAAAAVAAAFALSLTAVGSARSENKTLFYRGITITLNGSEIQPKDANGNAVEPFIKLRSCYAELQ